MERTSFSYLLDTVVLSANGGDGVAKQYLEERDQKLVYDITDVTAELQKTSSGTAVAATAYGY